MYDLMTTLLSGSAIWAYLGQDYDFNTSVTPSGILGKDDGFWQGPY
jgi:hypothetical protein